MKSKHLLVTSCFELACQTKYVSLHLRRAYERLQPLMLLEHTLITRQTEKIIPPLLQDFRSLNLARYCLQGGCSECIRLSRHPLFVYF